MMDEFASAHCLTHQRALSAEAARERLLRAVRPRRRRIPAVKLATALRQAADWLEASANSAAHAES